MSGVFGSSKVTLDAPQEHDKRPVVVMSPSTEGWMTWFSGAGDDPAPTPPASGRGQGQQLIVEWATADALPSTKQVEIRFIEPVEIHDGEMLYPPGQWGPKSRWDFSVRMPATTTTPNAGLGNCNLVDVGGFNLIVPAAGDGSHDVDLAQAVPVPASAGTGYWDADRNTGAVSPSATPGSASWALFDVEIKSYFMRNMPLGSPRGIFEIDTYKAEWISERWYLTLEVLRDAAEAQADTYVAAWLMFFREKST